MRLIIIASIILLSAVSYAKTSVYVSLLPQRTFLKAIAGDKVDVNVMVMPGASPATYEPKPKQMVELSSTDIYFAIGAPFENTWLSKFESMNPDMEIVHTDAGIKKRTVEKHVHEHEGDNEHESEHEHGHDLDHEHQHKDEHGHEHEIDHDDEHEHEHEHEGIKDPHVWLDPILVAKQAEVINNTLCKQEPESCAYFTANKNKFIRETDILNSKIEKIFKGKKDVHFMVFHPSWGYFADRYGLHQIPVELEGKEPKPSDLREFIKTVKKLKLKAIFIQPQFSKKAAELIAKETGARVVTVDPLSEDWNNNLLYVAKLIADEL